jgi:antitoxin (DNA-binding transcriptional repressor) of toxin-antitoxin stability system
MKAIKVTELKAYLSRYLRLASRGTRIVVQDRDEPIAELGPPRSEADLWPERLALTGRLRPGTQNWRTLKISTIRCPVDIQAALRDIREDPSEIRRR